MDLQYYFSKIEHCERKCKANKPISAIGEAMDELKDKEEQIGIV